jgi:hypothetical protein
MASKETKALQALGAMAADLGYNLFRGVYPCECSYILTPHDYGRPLHLDTRPSRPIPKKSEVLAVIKTERDNVNTAIDCALSSHTARMGMLN